ncbi:serine/threonine-protein kinase [Nonomuraea rhodomycinica]|uniref:non-specific serine/threonine protein kinase n=1 Tax=Nonomuraea rhodomycinica TaxID=1712872 RepID=A0A7Y6IKZ0_9ACTN|nr:serine/threonine-protein kinase [Nonomuraea rhodomycinica]NUW40018.1 serine/threonine protein kinase [Nonomuraea rhodomycinica]
MSGGRLAGRYSLIVQLGAGGMGKVWLARDEMLDREVAVKELTLPEGLPAAERNELVTRAVREAQATARLRHPGIVALHDVIVEYGRPWLVMELLRGGSLADVVKRHGPMPQEHAARVGADLLEALAAAHAQGLQHRDVKPGNVFITDTGRVVLTDFGIARQEGQAAITEQGLTIGSPGFIAPERLDGDPGGPASDLWSVGATLYYAVEGRPMYGGTAGERITATLTTPPPEVGGHIGPVIAALTARHPFARPDARTARDALRQVAAGQSPRLTVTHEMTAPGRVRRPRKGLLWGAVAAVVALAVVGAGVFLLVRQRGDGLPEAFTVPMDVCAVLPGEDVARLLRVQKPPAGERSSNEEGPTCGWTIPKTGIGLQLQNDSDTADPWSMTPASAHILFENQKIKWGKYRQIDWTWPEVGATGSNKATLTPVHAVTGIGEEAFGYEMKGPTGRMHSAHVYFRLANLVVRVEYTTLGDRPTDDDIKRTVLDAARATEQALRRAG